MRRVKNDAVIVSFKDAATEKLARGTRVCRFVKIESAARRELRQLEIAGVLDDLEGLTGQQARSPSRGPRRSAQNPGERPVPICFRWTQADTERVVEIVDYHEDVMTMTKLKPVTPGELLWSVEAHGHLAVPPRQGDRCTGAAHRRNRLGKRAITADTDLRLCRFFGLSDGYWLRAQAAYHTEAAQDELRDTLKRIRPWSGVSDQLGIRPKKRIEQSIRRVRAGSATGGN